ncbi:MAG TPA: hypothetical protein VNU93_08335, partial [Verrucomicrobiae bacterium]|nr:hypothetical protein [Verrucomicrobiae bacterium]
MSVDTKEQEFFATIAKRLGRPMPTTPPTREEAGAPEFWTEKNPSKEDMVKEFIENAQKLTVRTLV